MRKPGPAAWWLVVAVLAVGGRDPAWATFSGGNDKIAYTSVVSPGTSAARTAIFVDTVPLTNPVPGENHSWPYWSADGKKLVFVSQTSSPLEYRIEKINWDGGSPSNKFSRLEYRFTVDVAAGGRVQLIVKGYQSQNFEGDDFRFEWSTDGTTFTPITMASLQVVNDGTFRMGELPPALSGNVTLRVVDTDRTPGFQSIDSVTIDQIVVRSISP